MAHPKVPLGALATLSATSSAPALHPRIVVFDEEIYFFDTRYSLTVFKFDQE
jgi:hypothetical protein